MTDSDKLQEERDELGKAVKLMVEAETIIKRFMKGNQTNHDLVLSMLTLQQAQVLVYRHARACLKVEIS